MTTTILYKNFNVRQLQAYAALCLWNFGKHLGVGHSSIKELILHLMTMLTANNLSEWEQRGASIAITGRGDPPPEEITKLLTFDDLEAFNSLVESCVEVGIIDMYGASTNQPAEFVDRCVEILRHYSVEIPSTEVIGKYGSGSDEWGGFISDSELSEIFDVYGIDFSYMRTPEP